MQCLVYITDSLPKKYFAATPDIFKELADRHGSQEDAGIMRTLESMDKLEAKDRAIFGGMRQK